MAFVTAGDFRKGITFQDGNNIFIIVDFQHVKPGKGAAFVRTKIKNIITGAVLERTSTPSISSNLLISSVKKCNTFTTTANFTTSWIRIRMNKSPS